MALRYWWNKKLLPILFCFVGIVSPVSGDDGQWHTSTLDLQWRSVALPTDKAQLLQLRQEKVAAIRHLQQYPDNYTPSEAVFGPVTDGKPWASANRFYIINPHLLVSASPARKITPIAFWAPDENPPHEQTIKHRPGKTVVNYVGVSANHWMYWVNPDMRLWMVNARDAGFNYAMLDVQESKNIDVARSGNFTKKPMPLKSYYHYGTNVSANNLSPAYPAMRVRLNDYQQPTKLVVKLWRQAPADGEAVADYTHVIEVTPDPNSADFDSILDDEWDMFFSVFSIIDILTLLLPFLLLALGFAIGRYKENRHYKSIIRREKALQHIPVTTAFLEHENEDREVTYVKLVSGVTVVSVDYFKRFISFFRQLIGGEMKAYGTLVDRARREAIVRLKESCPDADVFINCRLYTSAAGANRRGIKCVEVIAYATAVRYKD